MLAAVTRHGTLDTAPPLPCHLPQKMSGHVWGALPPPLLTRPLQISLAAGCVGGMSTGMAATRAPQLLQRRRQAGQVRRASPMLPTLPRWRYFLSRLSACTQLVRALCIIYSILVLCSLQDFTGRPLGPAHPRLLQTGWAAHPPAWRHSLAPSASSSGSGSGSASGSAGDNAIGDNSSDTADDTWSLLGSWGWEGPDYVDNSWGNQDLLQLAGFADSSSHLGSRINVGEQVEAYLAGVGIEQAQLDRLRLLRNFRPVLQQPVEQRAGVLFGQLMGLGLSAAEAARCFEFTHQPATIPSFEAAIRVLADLLAAGSKGGEGGRQLLGGLLRSKPSAMELLLCNGSILQERVDYLLQLGLSQQQLAAAVQSSWRLLACSQERLAALQEVLHRELGADRQLVAKVLSAQPQLTWQTRQGEQGWWTQAVMPEDILLQRAQALVAVSAMVGETHAAALPGLCCQHYDFSGPYR